MESGWLRNVLYENEPHVHCRSFCSLLFFDFVYWFRSHSWQGLQYLTVVHLTNILPYCWPPETCHRRPSRSELDRGRESGRVKLTRLFHGLRLNLKVPLYKKSSKFLFPCGITTATQKHLPSLKHSELMLFVLSFPFQLTLAPPVSGLAKQGPPMFQGCSHPHPRWEWDVVCLKCL